MKFTWGGVEVCRELSLSLACTLTNLRPLSQSGVLAPNSSPASLIDA